MTPNTDSGAGKRCRWELLHGFGTSLIKKRHQFVTGKYIATLGQGCRPDCESQRGFNPALRLSLHFSTARLETMETARISQPCNCIIMTSDCHCDVSIPSGNTSLLFLPRSPSTIYSSLRKMCWLNTHSMKILILCSKNYFVKSS